MNSPANRRNSGTWKPGQSGNPRGKPRKSPEAQAVEALARTSSADALNTVLAIMRGGENDRVKLAAALAVLERGIGKAGEMVESIHVPAGATLADRAQAIADAAMAGAVSVAQASALLSCMASVAKVREVEELEQRIAALEALQKGST